MPRPQLSRLAPVLVLAAPIAWAQDFRTEAPVTIFTDGRRNVADAADVNGDGRIDLIAATDFGTRVFFNRGDLAFEAGGSLVDAHYATAVHAADFDGDGFIDVAIGDRADNAIDVWRGDGAGRFVRIASIPLSPPRRSAIDIASADIDADGFLDIVTANGADASVILADGLGGYALRGHFGAGGHTSNVVVSDMDKDGHLDLVLSCGMAYPGIDVFTVRYGDGTGLFPGRVSGSAPLAVGQWVAVADVDSDGRLDVVVAGQFPDGILVFRGEGARSFAQPETLVAAPRMFGVAARDVTGDGRIDLVAGGEIFAILDGVAGGTFASPRLFNYDRQNGPFVFADFDSDGFDDLAVASYTVNIYPVDARGSLSAQRLFREPGTDGPVDLALGDFDGDGRPDTAVAYTIDPALGGIVVRSSGGGQDLFESSRTLVTTSISAIAACDFVEDGRDDLLVLEPFGAVRVLPGDGAGGFLAPSHRSFTPFSKSIAADADFDSDGHLDLAGSDAARSEVALFRGDGTGRFAPSGKQTVPGTPGHIAAGDFDEDGHPDVIVILGELSAVGFLRGTGTGELGPPETSTVFPIPEFLATADLNGDGHLDVAVESRATREPFRPGTTSLLFGDGTGGFSPPTPVGSIQAGAYGIAAGDLNSDGNQDLVVAHHVSIDVLVGVGAGGFVTGFSRNPEVFVRDPAIADCDGDGRLDVLFQMSFDAGTTMGIANAGTLLLFNRTHYLGDALRGDVNARTGTRENVLFVNGSPGAEPERRVEVGIGEAFAVTMEAPTSMTPGTARFVLYEWPGPATEFSIVDLPLGLGRMGAAPPLVPRGLPRFDRAWNNIGRVRLLGSPTHPSSPAPSVVANFETGLGSPATLFLQGIIFDRNAPNGRAATTNGVQVVVR